MAKTKRKLSEELALLVRTGSRKTAGEEFDNLLIDFRTALNLLLERVNTSATIRCISPGWEATKIRHEYIGPDLGNSIFEALCIDNNLGEYLSYEGNERMLAWICLQHATAYNTISDDSRQVFRELLNKWSGLTIDKERPLTLDVITKILYGELAWDLYGEDLTRIQYDFLVQKVADRIHSVGLPLNFKNSTNANVQDVSLPGDLGI